MSDTEKINNIKKLLDMNGGRISYEKTVLQIIDAIKHLIPDFTGKLRQDEMDDIIDDIYETVIPIYDKYFTNDEILGIIDFYNSDLGKIYLSKMGAVTMESMLIGQKHGEIVYNKLTKKSDN